MATLVHRWKLDEGSGGSVADSVNGFTGTLEGPSLPQWVTAGGITALRFPGTDGGEWIASATDCARVDCHNALPIQCAIASNAYAITCWVNFQGSSASKPIVRIGTYDDAVNDYTPPIDLLYLGTNGKPHFGISLTSGATAVRTAIGGSTTLAGTTGWHLLVGQFIYNEGNDNTKGYAQIYVDSLKEGETSWDWTSYTRGPYAQRDCFLGHGLIYWRDTSIHWPNTSYYGVDTNTNGSLNGDLRDVRIYCGVLSQQEIDDIYDEKKVANAIMFSCNT